MTFAILAMLAVSIASLASTAAAMSWLIRVRRRPSAAAAFGAILGLLTPIGLYLVFLSLARGSDFVAFILLVVLLPFHLFVHPISAIVYASRRRPD